MKYVFNIYLQDIYLTQNLIDGPLFIQEPPLNSTYTQFKNLSEKQGQAAATVCITDGMYSKTDCCKAALNEKADKVSHQKKAEPF